MKKAVIFGSTGFAGGGACCDAILPGAPAFELDFTWVADPLIFKGPCFVQFSVYIPRSLMSGQSGKIAIAWGGFFK
jgi:hypothetical protein